MALMLSCHAQSGVTTRLGASAARASDERDTSVGLIVHVFLSSGRSEGNAMPALRWAFSFWPRYVR